MTLAAIIIVLTTPILYCVTRCALSFNIGTEWGALVALVAALAWVRLLLAMVL